MRKEYSKPNIMFESFSLSTNIAGDCSVKTGSPSDNVCGHDIYPFKDVFISSETGCQVTFENGQYGGICYHVPDGTNNLFNS
jgi:hypothetical protein